ncbi:MAG: long-chain fatty acid--CoA ligase [Armatimonadetes bacterium]|nr:long-chain fatty acid--CoA ligase [Armatimonadota bacterium]
MSEKTVISMFYDTAARVNGHPALSYKADGAYRDISYQELERQARAFSRGLTALGLERGKRAAILSENRPEWVVADLAVLAAGGADVPIFPTLPPGQIAYILEDSGAVAVVVSNDKQFKKVAAVRSQLSSLRHVIVMDGCKEAGEGVLTMEQVCEMGRALNEDTGAYERRWQSVTPDDLATIIYTSGTTGDPKGAMLSHSNFIANIEAIVEMVHINEDDLLLSFLPLCHVFERTAGYYSAFRVGARIAYCESIFSVQKNMEETRPTLMLAVPRLYESIQERIRESGKSLKGFRKAAFEKAMEAAESGSPSSLPDRLRRLVFDKLIYSKIRTKTGGRIRFLVSGGAPLPMNTALFFQGVGLLILEGYGLTETSPAISFNRPERFKFGTVGRALPGVEIKIAPDGEILCKGGLVMKGYWKKPEETAEAIDSEGWFHTGDIGEMDAEGFLKITDRKKNLLVLANGKKVAPSPIEANLKNSPYISEAVLIGDHQNTVSALIVPAFDSVQEWARANSIGTDSPAALAAHPLVKKLIKSEIDRFSDNLADFEKVKRFALLDRPFSEEGGELTPTLKIKRKFIQEEYRDIIQGLYSREAEAVA